MSSLQRKVVKNKSSGTKKKISDTIDPEEAQKTVKEQSLEIDKLQEKLTHANHEANELQIQIDATNKKHKELSSKFAQVSEDNKKIENENTELKNDNKEWQSRCEAVEAQLKTAEETSKKALEQTDRAKAKYDNENKELKTKIKELEDKHAELKSKLIVEVPEDTQEDESATQTSKFLVFIYNRQGNYNGRIIHLPSKDTLAFSDLGQDTIQKLILKHLPLADEDLEEVEESLDEPSKGAEIPSKLVDDKSTKIEEAASLTNLKVVPAVGEREGAILTHSEPLKVLFEINLESIQLANFKPFSYSANLYVRKLGGGEMQKVGKSEGTISSAQESPFAVEITLNPMPQGSYRLEAALALKTSNGDPAPAGMFMEGSLFRVF